MKANVLIKRILPDFEDRLLLRRVLYMPRDIFDTILGRRPAMMPPWGLRFVGDGDFTEIGERIVGFLQRFSGLRPEDSILDAGCGIGRLAVPLTSYLTTGSYEGFDIVRPAIRWCTRNITSKHQNFRFTWADIYNKHYNPKGRLTATSWKFPYQDSSFDVVVLSSVFTHMLPDGFRAYLAEVFRVLKPNGRCWSSLFLLNSESRELMSSGRAILKLPHRYSEHCFVLDPRFPETTVGYEEEFVKREYIRAGLHPTLLYGSWCGRAAAVDYQDVVLVSRVPPRS